jgi:hypothetical protein
MPNFKDHGLNKPKNLESYYRDTRGVALCSLCLCGKVSGYKILPPKETIAEWY